MAPADAEILGLIGVVLATGGATLVEPVPKKNREGRYGDVGLDGLNVVAFASFKGNLWEGAHSEPKMGVVMDERADEGQREALQMIFGGQAGGWPARLNELRCW